LAFHVLVGISRAFDNGGPSTRSLRMYVLYIANKNYSSWSLRPWVLLRELHIDFEEALKPFQPGSNWDQFRTFSPSGKVPCLADGGRAVWDSLAIAEYLAERHEGVWPANVDARAWARCAAAEMHSGFSTLRETCPMCCAIRLRLSTITPALESDLRRIEELWIEGLNRFGGPFLAGDRFTAVDAFFAPVAFRTQSYHLEFARPAADYVQRLLDLPSMQEWYAAGLAEPWRDARHDIEIAKQGTIIADLRTG
jgi:glutathione S-transferase